MKDEPGEIDMAIFFSILWASRRLIISCTAVVTALGIAYAFLATPVYYSQATISLKEAGKGGDASKFLSQFGGVGGIVSSQLGLGSTSLDKLEVILKGHELAESVIVSNDLLPVLFPNLWEPKIGKWRTGDGSGPPTLRDGGRFLREKSLKVSLDNKKGMIRLGISLYDSLLAKQIVEYYLEGLNRKIRSDVIRDSDANREYLEKQMNNAIDPTLREKILGMIGIEIEKSMLVATQAFEILEKPIVPFQRSKPKRKTVVILAFLSGLCISTAAIFGKRSLANLRYAMDSDNRTEHAP